MPCLVLIHANMPFVPYFYTHFYGATKGTWEDKNNTITSRLCFKQLTVRGNANHLSFKSCILLHDDICIATIGSTKAALVD